MKGIYTILLLIVSNVFMTFAWYGHLKMKQEYTWFASLPLIGVIAFSWAIAFFEYSCQIPANRIGFIGNGGPFTLMQLKVIQHMLHILLKLCVDLILVHFREHAQMDTLRRILVNAAYKILINLFCHKRNHRSCRF